jgi:hypothetical protein
VILLYGIVGVETLVSMTRMPRIALIIGGYVALSGLGRISAGDMWLPCVLTKGNGKRSAN